jgi:RsiW-degrading membrane proteinase PrsW (M82 family)
VNEVTVTSGSQRVVLQPGQAANVGRRDDSALVVSDPRVSREHLRLAWEAQAGCWIVENVGRAGAFVSGQPVTQFYLTQPVEVRLAAPDGPPVLLEPGVAAATANQPAAAAQAAAPQPAAAAAAAQPAGQPAMPWPVAAGAGAPRPGAPAGQPFWGPQPPMPGGGAPAPGTHPTPGTGAGTNALGSIMHTLIPVKTWLTDPALRQWPRLLIAAYALAPVILLILLQNTTDLKTLGWVYCLYIAPLWALVFWWLIRPGPVGRLHLGIGAIIVAAEFILIPALTTPWEDSLAPGSNSHSLIRYIYGVGLAEEITKALPVLVLAVFLLKARGTKLDVRMWMFLATLSGLTFGVYEASTVYVPLDIVTIAKGGAIGIPEFVERVFVDGLQHALWAGVAGFFIGLGTNYRRQRFLLWSMGIAIPAILHGLNDWSLSGVFGNDLWVWIAIQAFSVFLFLGYAASAHAIEQEVRHTPIFRGQSMMIDRSQLQMPPGGR